MSPRPARPKTIRPARDPITSAVVSIRRLVRVLRLTAQRTQSLSGISAAQLFVLQQLGADGHLSLNELAARTLTDRSSVADVVDRLVAQGLVDRTIDPRDRRRALVRITASGRGMLARAPDAPTTALIGALRSLTPTERRALARSLDRLTLALGAGNEPATMLFADDEQSEAATTTSRRRRPSARKK